MRRAFQIALLLVAFLPFAIGVVTLFQGAVRLVPPELVTGALDGQVRFWGLRSMLPFLLTVWIVRNLERAGAVLFIILATTAAGGLARIVSAMQYGGLELPVMGAIALEIGVLAFIPWYRAVLRANDRAADGHNEQ